MKAAVVERYGPPGVVQIRDVPKPIPTDDGILVRIRTTTLNSGDARMRALRVPRGLSLAVRLDRGFRRPRQPILGFELAGDVEAVGSGVTAFTPGTRVMASAGFELGCHAEYRCLAQHGPIAPIPDNLSYEDAVALCFGGSAARYFLERANLRRGESLLINGASGAVGTMAVQLAKHRGARVTGVCSARNAALVSSLGADEVIDYAVDDFTKRRGAFDVVLDTVGNVSYRRAKECLKPDGRFVMVISDLGQMILGGFRRQVIGPSAKESELYTADVVRHLMELGEGGVIKPVIDSTFPFERIVDAHARVDSGRKRGAVIVKMTCG